MQQGMLFHNLYEQHSGVNIEQIVCTLKEDVDQQALKRAWERVVETHAALRTSFRVGGEAGFTQKAHERVALPFSCEEWIGLAQDECDDRLSAFLERDRLKGFDISTPPLMRLNLFILDQHSVLVWTFHHSLLDGRSFTIILKEVFRSYDAFLKGETINAPSPRPYSEYIEWISRQDWSEAERFWRERLRGFASPTTFGIDKTQNPANVSVGHKEESIRLSTEITSALNHFARENGLTVNTLVQAAWAFLLSRYSGEGDVVFGAVRACRRSSVEGAEDMVGVFINTLPVRVRVKPDVTVLEWLREIRAAQLDVRLYEHTPLVRVQACGEVPRGAGLFESIIVFENYLLNSALRSQAGEWLNREFRLLEQTNYPITLYGYAEPELLLKISYDKARFDQSSISRALGHLATLLEAMAANPYSLVADLPMLTARGIQDFLDWNLTDVSLPQNLCIHYLIERQAALNPDAVAVICGERSLSYEELNKRANRLARSLNRLGVGAEDRVAISLERSLEMMIALLGVLKSGGAYVPLDPSYPRERVGYMLEDSRSKIVLTEQRLAASFSGTDAKILCLDSDWHRIAVEESGNLADGANPENIAYVIYTSGSTGRPKGVMVEHRNLTNFFAGMDRSVGEHRGVWLAVTSISFDISVLELLWTLARGFKVVLYQGREKEIASARASENAARKIDFSLFYFASNNAESTGDAYRLLIEGAKFADKEGFAAIWTPERHFHAFGGLYPNPSVTSAAIATVTERIAIRAGSVVAPIHSPIRIAEEWAVVDNLSKGRVGISFASGWHDRDFVFEPDNYENRRQLMFEQIDQVRRLWRGESITTRGGAGGEVTVRIFPQPVQKELPFWLTAGGSPDTFRAAGEVGAHVLTHLLFQKVEDIAHKIALYRKAWRDAGHAGEGHVTMMLHAFLGPDIETVRRKVKAPFCDYLRSSVDLMQQVSKGLGEDLKSRNLTESDIDALLEHAFDRYFDTSGLFGTPETCAEMIDRLKGMGVDEVACLIDFGVDVESALSGLQYLSELKERVAQVTAGESIPDLIRRHEVTHLQCTPSMARMLASDADSMEAMASLQHLLLGGESLPATLLEQLQRRVRGEILNMYGPTETTIWSTTERFEKADGLISIGRPIANTQTHIVDFQSRQLPAGVAGELLIGGAGVARGYLNLAEMTAQRFVPNPFASDSATRLYRTGDLARNLSDGRLEFIGRVDNQVKIRGFRIEMGEIESTLADRESVRDAVVIVKGDEGGDSRLFAYVIPEDGQSINTTALRSRLQERLPDHMIPAAIVVTDRFPLTPNKKIDRKALAAIEVKTKEALSSYVAPQSDAERRIAGVWSSVLKVERVGLHDKFFDRGGDSLLAVRVIAHLQEQFGYDLKLVDFFKHPTVNSLAAYVTGKSRDDSAIQESKDRAMARRDLRSRRQTLRQNDRAPGAAQS